MGFKIDLHTHSTLSYDGGISTSEYSRIFNSERLDYVAITDHHTAERALELHQKYGERIIVGEEMRSMSGDIIGLFMKETIPSGLSLKETVEKIKEQNALVYIPHPFDPIRYGISKRELEAIIGYVDIIEVFNARYVAPRGNASVVEFCRSNPQLHTAVGSDAHSFGEIGRTYTEVSQPPNRSNLLELLSASHYVKRYIYPWQFLNPKLNMLRKSLS